MKYSHGNQKLGNYLKKIYEKFQDLIKFYKFNIFNLYISYYLYIHNLIFIYIL